MKSAASARTRRPPRRPQAGRRQRLRAIGQVVEIAGSGSQIRMDAAAVTALQSHTDPSVAMSGQVGSQVKMVVGNSLADRQRPHAARPAIPANSSPTSTSSAKARRDSTGRMTNFRRGVTRYPIPGAEVLPVTTEDLRSIFAASDEPHIEIGTVYPTDDIRGALYVDPMLGEAFRGARIDRYRQVDLGRADPPPHLAAFARGSHRDDRPARRIFGRVQGLRRAVQRRQSAAALLADELRGALRSAPDHRTAPSVSATPTSSPSACSPPAPRART